jgi:uncharacterized protein (DUF433 family)
MITIPRELNQILVADPEIMGGAICFANTRIPVEILLDNVEGGTPWDVFYDNYPSLTLEMVRPVLAGQHSEERFVQSETIRQEQGSENSCELPARKWRIMRQS